MRTLYLQCTTGCSGDMLFGALLALHPDPNPWLARFAQAGIPRVRLATAPCQKCGVRATQVSVHIDGHLEEDAHHHHHQHAHSHLGDIQTLLSSLSIPEPVRTHARQVYQSLAQAESLVHGQPVEQVHFHEVGSLDAVADIVGVCWLLEELQVERILASPVAVGSGTVRCAHGTLPVPAPATAELLRGVPVSAGEIAAELCTPTGAALLRTFAGDFGPMPAGTILDCGCGCGAKDFPRANCLRAFLLDTARTSGGPNDAVTELRANLDDMTGEDLGFAMERLLEAGALDVSYVPLQMKKGRPGALLICLCRPADADRLAGEVLRHTATFGVRRFDCARYALSVDPDAPAAETEYGPVRRKAGMGYGVAKCKPEYEDLAAAARAGNVPLSAVREAFGKSR